MWQSNHSEKEVHVSPEDFDYLFDVFPFEDSSQMNENLSNKKPKTEKRSILLNMKNEKNELLQKLYALKMKNEQNREMIASYLNEIQLHDPSFSNKENHPNMKNERIQMGSQNQQQQMFNLR